MLAVVTTTARQFFATPCVLPPMPPPSALSSTQTAYLAFIAKVSEPPYSRSPRWISRPFATSHLRPGDRVRVWHECAMGRDSVVVELRQNDALVELPGGREWVRASVIELVDESVLRER